MVRGYVAGANEWLRTHQVTDPACAGAAYLKPDVTAARPLVRRLPGQPARLGRRLRQGDRRRVAADARTTRACPSCRSRAADVDRDALLKALGRDPEAPFGSNATAVGGDATTTGRGMLLGNPHFPWRGRYHFTQQHLTIPGKYDVAGASLIGSPVGQHRLEQGRRVEPHRVDGVPLHAVRVQDRRPRHDLPHRRRPAGARSTTP